LNVSGALGKTGFCEEPQAIAGLENMVENFEKNIIERSLNNNGYNQTKTSKELGISRTTLQYKIQKYSITVKNID